MAIVSQQSTSWAGSEPLSKTSGSPTRKRRPRGETGSVEPIVLDSWQSPRGDSGLELDAAAQVQADVAGPGIELVAGNGDRLKAPLIAGADGGEDTVREIHFGTASEAEHESGGGGLARHRVEARVSR